MSRSYYLLAVAAAAAAVLGTATAGRGDDLKTVVRGAAEDCAKWMKGERQKALALGSVTGPDTFPTSGGPIIRDQLERELPAQGVTVKLVATVGLRVKYLFREVPDAKDRKHLRPAVDLVFTFTDGAGVELERFERRVTDPASVRLILGLSVDTTTVILDDVKADEATVTSFRDPKAALDGTVALSGPDSTFGIEIVRNKVGVPLADRDGLAFANLARDDQFDVRLVNRSNTEMAVKLAIDGLSVFHFTDVRIADGPRKGEPRYSMVLVKPKDSVVVPGWHKTNALFERFKITEYAKSGAGLVNRDDARVGTITASFAAAWVKAPPADEPPLKKSPTDAVGFGCPVPGTTVPVERTVGAERATVSVRYEVAK
ncbi:hypothetical protein [Limnoglobus roseus]|uniref:Uncharacterized protein n=1 Tax=Limnoglobus roseus TaxID=2598579 RepID=A0A5C1ANV2_9BACT|nr:hypothetical protein [Limnoglobus roseus]QEL20670.1 hypothetical protein PX52LOC_07777 [Limnoglobus roseus]